MDQDLENLWLDRYVLSVEQVEQLIHEVDDLRANQPAVDELKGRICEMEAEAKDRAAEIAGLQAEIAARNVAIVAARTALESIAA
ncbi:hypothetical protein [Roseomonas sp. USHLN139]|uniref:hypothetical protein n=1 Tax=Roseomonas sp. USHLN139 TaxID=3081298 RepID=UPI003B01719A